jgi:glycerophosphoryl diester phosphodiesterase
MRSSPFAADPLDPGPAGFAHRGLHCGSTIPENTLAAFVAALEIGAGIECDLRLTADDRIVVFHDADTSRLCGSPLKIGQSPFAELSAQRVGAQPIPTLQELLDLVAGKEPLLLEVKVERDLRRWIPVLRRELAHYRGRFAVMSFDPRLLRMLARNMPDVRRGLLLQERRSFVERRTYIRIAGPDFLGVDLPALRHAWVRQARRVRPVYAWTVRTAEERAQAEVQADALIWEGDGGPGI